MTTTSVWSGRGSDSAARLASGRRAPLASIATVPNAATPNVRATNVVFILYRELCGNFDERGMSPTDRASAFRSLEQREYEDPGRNGDDQGTRLAMEEVGGELAEQRRSHRQDDRDQEHRVEIPGEMPRRRRGND